jgi:2,3-diaminopropionate biosynthesis protein SbnA
MIGESILSIVGNTPLIRLNRALDLLPFRLFAKLEAFNPGGSIKDRAAFTIINKAIEHGEITAGTTIIESSSGNMGIGLALACAHYGFRFICVVDLKTTGQNIDILRAYGAEVDMVTEPDPITGEFLPARIKRVETLLRTIENSYWPNQYSNPRNSAAHHQTMREIIAALDGRLDYLFCATSTCGTLRGCAEYVKETESEVAIVAVDAIGSVIFGGQPMKRLIPGHGAARRPELYGPELAYKSILVSDLECVIGCRRLVRRESILAGGSSGALLMAVEKMRGEIPDGSTCVMILPDRGERYLDSIFCDSWVYDHFGDVSHLWQGNVLNGENSRLPAPLADASKLSSPRLEVAPVGA